MVFKLPVAAPSRRSGLPGITTGVGEPKEGERRRMRNEDPEQKLRHQWARRSHGQYLRRQKRAKNKKTRKGNARATEVAGGGNTNFECQAFYRCRPLWKGGGPRADHDLRAKTRRWGGAPDLHRRRGKAAVRTAETTRGGE